MIIRALLLLAHLAYPQKTSRSTLPRTISLYEEGTLMSYSRLPSVFLRAPLTVGLLCMLSPVGWAAGLTIDTGRPADTLAVIAGRDGMQQLVVTLTTDDGQLRDVTREVSYTAEPAANELTAGPRQYERQQADE